MKNLLLMACLFFSCAAVPAEPQNPPKDEGKDIKIVFSSKLDLKEDQVMVCVYFKEGPKLLCMSPTEFNQRFAPKQPEPMRM